MLHIRLFEIFIKHRRRRGRSWRCVSSPHIVPRDGFCCKESWSEWQDLNLRPPRPERGARPPYSVRQQRLSILIRAAASKNSRFGTDFGTQLFVTRCQSKGQAGTTERESSIKSNFANTTQH